MDAYQGRSTGNISASDITSLTDTTPKTWRIYTHSGRRDTRINLHSRNTDGVETRGISRVEPTVQYSLIRQV